MVPHNVMETLPPFDQLQKLNTVLQRVEFMRKSKHCALSEGLETFYSASEMFGLSLLQHLGL